MSNIQATNKDNQTSVQITQVSTQTITHSLTVGVWASYLILMNLSLLSYKMGTMP